MTAVKDFLKEGADDVPEITFTIQPDRHLLYSSSMIDSDF